MESERLKQIQKPLLNWYRGNARVLPWREHPDAYSVWVSEIMLQQTRVEAVLPYYERFMEALPDIRSLAECPEDQLMKLWEGLGYYSRARNMQKMAKIVLERYEGVLPKTPEELSALPGIGSYTAGAIASIAYGVPVPAVDGNVLRVLSRITKDDADITKQSAKREAEKALAAVMPQESPGDFNQALMELGAMVCLPNREPACACCPVSGFCLADRDGDQEAYPVRSPKKPRRVQERTVLVIRDSAHAALIRRPATGLLAGLFELPNFEGHLSQEEALRHTADLGFSPIRISPLPAANHVFTHVEWHMTGYLVLVEEEETREEQPEGGVLFLPPDLIRAKYPIPSAFAAYTANIFIAQSPDFYYNDFIGDGDLPDRE